MWFRKIKSWFQLGRNYLPWGLRRGPPVFRNEALAFEFLIDSINNSTGVDSFLLGFNWRSDAWKHFSGIEWINFDEWFLSENGNSISLSPPQVNRNLSYVSELEITIHFEVKFPALYLGYTSRKTGMKYVPTTNMFSWNFLVFIVRKPLGRIDFLFI